MKILDSSATIMRIVKIQYPRIENVTRLQTIFDELIEVRAKLKNFCPGKSTKIGE